MTPHICPACRELKIYNTPRPHPALKVMSVMPDYKLYNCKACGAFATLTTQTLQWIIETLEPVKYISIQSSPDITEQ